MTPQELYKAVNAYDTSIEASNVCELHKPCLRTPKCGTKQRSQLIDFDRVKETYCKNNKLPALSSVDGLTVTDKNKVFFFVEIKSWENVITHPVSGRHADLNVIEKTAREYAQDLAKKLNESQKICCDITKVADLFASEIKPALVFVTDIEVKTNPIAALAETLTTIAASASTLKTYCNTQMNASLENLRKKIDVYYTTCRNFDQDLKTYE